MTESVIYLQESLTGELIPAVLCDEITDEHLQMWNRDWVPEMKHFGIRGGWPLPEDFHWDWKVKAEEWRRYLKYQSAAIVCDGRLQGLLLLSNLKSARLEEQFGKPLMYIEYLATAPWNRPEMQVPPRFRGVGRVFIMAAIHSSFDAGYKGRIGLHSLPSADDFYQGKCGMTRLGLDSAYQDLSYFEMTENQANEYRHNFEK